MVDLTQQRNAQIIAPLVCAQDSARQLGSGAEHKTAKEPVESENNKLFEQASSKPSKIVQIPKQVRNDDFSLVNENNNKTSCHPEFISGSYQSCDSTHSRSNSEHTSQTAKELLEERKVSKKNNPNFCFMFHPFFGAKNGWSPRNSRPAVPFIQKVTQTCARQLGLYKLLSLIKLKCLLYLHSPQTNLACSCL